MEFEEHDMSEEKIIHPGPGESRSAFMSRCMTHYAGRPREQALAICMQEWRGGKDVETEALFKGLLFKGTLAKAADGLYLGIASTSEEDRDGEIIQPSAFTNLARIVAEQGPIYYQHAWRNFGAADEQSMPVGKIVSGEVMAKELRVGFQFASGGPLTFAPKVQWMVDKGFLKYMSVGAIPIKWETDKEGRRVYTELELLEVSIVGIPSNRGAAILNEMKVAGFQLSKDEEDLLGSDLDDHVPNGGVADEIDLERYRTSSLADQWEGNHEPN
jgi:HK97 family phage prohead protease